MHRSSKSARRAANSAPDTPLGADKAVAENGVAASQPELELLGGNARASRSGPKVGVVFNHRSHRNKSGEPAMEAGQDITIVRPENRDDLPGVLAQFAREKIDLLVINGGDGTVRDVITYGAPIFGDLWPDIAVMPHGKTNALNVGLDGPRDFSLAQSIAAWRLEKRERLFPLKVERLKGAKQSGLDAAGEANRSAAKPLLGFVLGAGAFTKATQAGQDAHRLGAFDGLAVGVTAFWAVMQTLLGSNRNVWRRGTNMRIWLGSDIGDDKSEAEDEGKAQPLPYSGVGSPRRRALLFSSTLQRFPVGMQPFGPHSNQIGLTVMDSPLRRLVMLLPAIVSGYRPAWLDSLGFHQRAVESFVMELDDHFILDGEAYPAGRYRVSKGPVLSFVVP